MVGKIGRNDAETIGPDDPCLDASPINERHHAALLN